MASSSLGRALITGASAGIGAVYADRLARRGYDLLLVALDPAGLESVAEPLRRETGRAVEVLTADLTGRSDLARVAALLAADETITLLVNNAGRSLNGGLLQSSPDQIENLIALNITAATVLATATARVFGARQAGAIINMSSTSALAPEHADPAYAGSKSYLLCLSLKLAAELKGTGVRVQAVLPGAVRTALWTQAGKDVDLLLPGRVMDPGDLVDAALAGFDRGEMVTIPPLADEALWTAYEAARLAMVPQLSARDVAERYRP